MPTSTSIDYRLAFEMAPVGLALSRNRIMKRVDGRFKGETFWCHVTGRAMNQKTPHEAGIWTFEDLSASRSVQAGLTPREREVATHLMEGLTSKEIGRALTISHRTVEVYRARLMRKYNACLLYTSPSPRD